MSMIVTKTAKARWEKGLLASIASILAGIIIPGAAHAVDTANPDWPCIQRKVPALSPTQIWDGPATDDKTLWKTDQNIRKIAKYLVSRRIPIEDAEKAVKKFAGEQVDDKRDDALTNLFAAVLDFTNTDRKIVMNGIERFNKRQIARAAELERQSSALQKAQAAEQATPPPDQPASTLVQADRPLTAQEKYDWDVRVFQERQQSLPIACEVPVLIEQRAYEIGRLIRQEMKS